MNWKLSNLILALLLLTAATNPATAQPYAVRWIEGADNNGIALRQGWHVEWFRGGEGRYEGDNVPEVAFIWSDTRNHDRGVYLQVIDTNGNLKFDDNGIRIADTNNRQEDPIVWPSRDGGWFVSWEDFDSDTLGNIFCTKIDGDGERLWGNDEHGVAVMFDTSYVQEDIRIVGDGADPEGCIIAWRDFRHGDADIYAMHVLGNGELDRDNNWPEGGLPIVRVIGPQTMHTADSDYEGGMIIGWKDGRDEDQTDIWAQRITPAGELLWGQGRGIIVCNNQSHQNTPKLCPDGQRGAFVTWMDERNHDTNKDIYAQRISSDGRLLWGNEGMPLCDFESEQSGNRIVYVGNGAAVAVWEDKRNERETTDIYSMRISGVNSLSKEWEPTTGVPVAIINGSNQKSVRLYGDGAGGAYYVWEDERDNNFPEIDIWAQRINQRGDDVWDENGIPVCTVSGTQQAPLLRRTVNNGAVIAWSDYRSGSSAIYAQRFNPNGENQWDDGGIALVDSIDGMALYPKILSRYNGSEFSVAWLDGRRGDTLPYLQFCRDDGDHVEFLLDPDGIPVLSGTVGGGVRVDICNDENGGTFVVWKDQRIGNIYSVYGQYINSDGQKQWGESGIKISEAETDYEKGNPRVCYDGESGIYVAWESDTEGEYINLFMQHVGSDGNLLWDEEMTRITGHRMHESIETLMPGHNNSAILLWRANNQIDRTEDDVWVVRVDADRNFLWHDPDDQNEGLVVCNAQLIQNDASIIRHPEGYVVVWVDYRDDENGEPQRDIRGQFINDNGSFRWRENGAAICGEENHQDEPSVTIDNDGYIWVVWVDHRYATGIRQRDLYIQKVSPVATQDFHVPTRLDDRPYGGDGVPICAERCDQTAPYIISDGSDGSRRDDPKGVWVVWEDLRGGLWPDIYATHLDSLAAPLRRWGNSGRPTCDAFHRQENPQLIKLTERADLGVIVCWIDKRATGKEELSNLFIQRIDDFTLDAPPQEPLIIPIGFRLGKAYPNPFNGITVMQYVVPYRTKVKLDLYDLTGRHVRNFLSESASTGSHKLIINAEDLASGAYLVRLTSGEVKLERKITLIK